MRVLVVTVVHHPLDARVFTREIGTLLATGHQVTYAAPWSAFDVEPPDQVTGVDLPRAQGFHRAKALRAARRLMRREADNHDIVLVHNPELLLGLIGNRARRKAVLDVHEDLATALVDKAYLPGPLRRPLVKMVDLGERWAERNLDLLLAEQGYLDRFRDAHPVVPNEPVVPDTVPPPGTDRVAYLGRVSEGRGLEEMLATASRLPEGVRMEILGWGDDNVLPQLKDAACAGSISWTGRIDNEVALQRLDGALCGLSLLHDLPNYRHSRPTKIVEYMSRGIPTITTPLPVAVEIVEKHRCGIVVPFGDADAVVDAITHLRADHDLRQQLARHAHEAALRHFNWARSGPEFVRILEDRANDSRTASTTG